MQHKSSPREARMKLMVVYLVSEALYKVDKITPLASGLLVGMAVVL